MTATTQQPFQSGFRTIDGSGLDAAFSQFGFSTFNGNVTATAGGSQSTSQILTANSVNDIGTVTTTNDSVSLPTTSAATLPMVIFVGNRGANTMKVFAQGSDVIQATAGATGVTVASGTNAVYFCAYQGYWREIQGT